MTCSDLMLDGELVILDKRGRPHFGSLRGRLAMTNAATIKRAAREGRAAIFAFDLLELLWARHPAKGGWS